MTITITTDQAQLLLDILSHDDEVLGTVANADPEQDLSRRQRALVDDIRAALLAG